MVLIKRQHLRHLHSLKLAKLQRLTEQLKATWHEIL